jgi:hypothetical protein
VAGYSSLVITDIPGWTGNLRYAFFISGGFEIIFDYVSYGTGPYGYSADGLSFFLIDASPRAI